MKNLFKHEKLIDKGFTFVELLVVITIIGIIFASGIVSYTSISQRSRDTRRKSDIEAIRQSLEMCRSLSGVYPANITNSVTCTTGEVLMTTVPNDPKPCPGVTYTYVRPTTVSYTLTAPCMESGVYSVSQP